MNRSRKTKKISIARRIALDVLRRVEAEGAYASLALEHALTRRAGVSAADRALAMQLVYGTLRWRRRLDYALAAHSNRPLERIEPSLLRILRLTAFQLLFLDRVPQFAAVDEGTELAVTLRGKRAGGFVNAVARGLSRARDRIEWPDPEQNPVRHLAVLYSFPSWMVEHWVQQHGRERAEALMDACNRPAPLWLRANTLKGSSQRLLELLGASGLACEPSGLVADALRFDGAVDLRRLAAHEAGWLHVQDAGAQAVCQLLGPRPGERVLDACAAPGGKTATLAQLMRDSGELVAVDRHPARLGLVRKMTERLGLASVSRVLGDLLELDADALGTFDRILLDAPCSALGVLRRHPEGKWRLGPEDVKRMARVQAELLDSLVARLRPGGVLVYSVCTFSQEEGPKQIERWLARHPEMRREDPRREKRASWHKLLVEDGSLRTWPDAHDMDGFFAVRLRREPAAESPRGTAAE